MPDTDQINKKTERKKTAKVYQVLEEDYRAWEMQPWDTQKSYEMFLCYYWPQMQRPRSVNEAYRNSYSPVAKKIKTTEQDAEKEASTPPEVKKKSKPVADNQDDGKRVAPSNWRRWSMGQNNAGEQLFFDLIKGDGQAVTQKVPSWNERAKAWDKDEANKKIDGERVMRRQVRKLMETTMLQSATVIAKAWQAYTPSGREGLGELAAATKSMFGQLSDHFELDDNTALFPELEEIMKDTQTISQGEALQRIKDLIAPKRNKAA